MQGPGSNTQANSASFQGQAQYGAAGGMLPPQQFGNRDFLYCIPMAIGPPTEHARSLKYWLVRSLVIQGICCVLKFVVLRDWFSGLWMAVVILVGIHGYWENMNITYICLWGVACAINGVIDTLGCIMTAVIALVKFDFTFFVKILMPLSYLIGAAFAYHLYLDWAQATGHKTSWLLSCIPDIFKLMGGYENKTMAPSNDQYALNKGFAVPPPGQQSVFQTQPFNPQQQQYPQQHQYPQQQGQYPVAPQQQQQQPGSPGGLEGWLQGLGAQFGSAAAQGAAGEMKNQAQNQAAHMQNQASQAAQSGAWWAQNHASQAASGAQNQAAQMQNQAAQMQNQASHAAQQGGWWGQQGAGSRV